MIPLFFLLLVVLLGAGLATLLCAGEWLISKIPTPRDLEG